MKQTFEIPGHLPNLNDHLKAANASYKGGNRLKREAQERIVWAIKAAHIKPVESYPVFVAFTWIEPNMRRDKDNVAFAKKYILDALQVAGILKDDGWKQVEGFTDSFRVNPREPRVIVEIEEA